jgi:hypothetical protein
MMGMIKHGVHKVHNLPLFIDISILLKTLW